MVAVRPRTAPHVPTDTGPPTPTTDGANPFTQGFEDSTTYSINDISGEWHSKREPHLVRLAPYDTSSLSRLALLWDNQII